MVTAPRIETEVMGGAVAPHVFVSIDGKPVGHYKILTRYQSNESYYNVEFSPLELIGVANERDALLVLVDLYRTMLERLENRG